MYLIYRDKILEMFRVTEKGMNKNNKSKMEFLNIPINFHLLENDIFINDILN